MSTHVRRSLFDRKIVRRAAIDALAKLSPRIMMRNPVMFVVEVGSVLTTMLLLANGYTHRGHLRFNLQITLWLWFTVLFANFAEAMAEGRGKAQADALRQAKSETTAYRITKGGVQEVPSSQLRVDDVVRVEAGHVIPGDGEVIEGIASVDESAITGESAPVIREAGGDRSAVTGGTRVLSDAIVVRITSNPGETFLDRMIALVEGAERQKTPNEIALNILLAGLTIIFLLAVVTLQPFSIYSGAPQTVTVSRRGHRCRGGRSPVGRGRQGVHGLRGRLHAPHLRVRRICLHRGGAVVDLLRLADPARRRAAVLLRAEPRLSAPRTAAAASLEQ
jgi:potassium-transporting ATPase ATP-binding subunit